MMYTGAAAKRNAVLLRFFHRLISADTVLCGQCRVHSAAAAHYTFAAVTDILVFGHAHARREFSLCLNCSADTRRAANVMWQ
jgi:hypothetical protein